MEYSMCSRIFIPVFSLCVSDFGKYLFIILEMEVFVALKKPSTFVLLFLFLRSY